MTDTNIDTLSDTKQLAFAKEVLERALQYTVDDIPNHPATELAEYSWDAYTRLREQTDTMQDSLLLQNTGPKNIPLFAAAIAPAHAFYEVGHKYGVTPSITDLIKAMRSMLNLNGNIDPMVPVLETHLKVWYDIMAKQLRRHMLDVTQLEYDNSYDDDVNRLLDNEFTNNLLSEEGAERLNKIFSSSPDHKDTPYPRKVFDLVLYVNRCITHNAIAMGKHLPNITIIEPIYESSTDQKVLWDAMVEGIVEGKPYLYPISNVTTSEDVFYSYLSTTWYGYKA